MTISIQPPTTEISSARQALLDALDPFDLTTDETLALLSALVGQYAATAVSHRVMTIVEALALINVNVELGLRQDEAESPSLADVTAAGSA